jgi:dTDP-4-dehydrorhamnose reductase
MRCLVTGSAGLVGSQVVKDLLQENTSVYAGYHKTKPHHGIPIQFDLTNFDNVINIVETIKPDVIIHLAALTNVDQCETEKDLAFQLNTKATEKLVEVAVKYGSFFIYVSTDYVFDGQQGMKKEDDVPNPIDYYGKTKLEGEIIVKKMGQNWCIVRTSTPYCIHPEKKTFPIFVAEHLLAKKEINVVKDQFTSPTCVENLSHMLIEIANRRLEGIFHLAGATRISRYDLAIMVAEKLRLDKKFLKPVSITAMNWIAKRPKDSSLDVSKAASILEEKPMTIEDGLDLLLKKIKFN